METPSSLFSLEHLVPLLSKQLNDESGNDGANKSTCKNDNIGCMKRHDFFAEQPEGMAWICEIIKYAHFVDNQYDDDRIDNRHQPRHAEQHI